MTAPYARSLHARSCSRCHIFCLFFSQFPLIQFFLNVIIFWINYIILIKCIRGAHFLHYFILKFSLIYGVLHHKMHHSIGQTGTIECILNIVPVYHYHSLQFCLKFPLIYGFLYNEMYYSIDSFSLSPGWRSTATAPVIMITTIYIYIVHLFYIINNQWMYYYK